MARLPLDEVQPRMVLSEPVVNAQGVLLLPAETPLSEENIRTLRSWGVTQVTVRKPTAGASKAQDADPVALASDIRRTLDARFGETAADPVMAQIMEIAAELLAARRNRGEE